jgi:folate-binding protein YgfZ
MDVGHTTALYSDTSARSAQYIDEGGVQVPASFADPNAELAAAHDRAALVDITHLAHFTLGGKDGPKFVQGLTTNDILALEIGAGCYTAFLNVHGRIEADCYVYRFASEYLLQTRPEAGAWLAASLGRFVRAGDFKFASLRDTHAALTVQGPKALELLGAALSVPLGELPSLRCTEARFQGADVRVVRTRRSSVGGADVIGDIETLSHLWQQLESPEYAIVPAGVDTLEVLRMEAGLARFGRDFDNGTVLQEVDAPEIVSFKKGCYLGQEIVARVHYLGQPSKLLRRFAIDTDLLPSAGDEILASEEADAKPVGHVTSVCLSPERGTIVFGVVKRKYYAPGTAVFIRTGQGVARATVAERNRSALEVTAS